MITGLARLEGRRSSSWRAILPLWRRLDRRRLRQGGRAVSISPRPSTCRSSTCGLPGLPDRAGSREGRHHPPRRARDGRGQPVTVPWCTVIVRNSFGVAGVVHQPAGRFSMRYAWPSACWGSLPLEGGIEAAYRAEIEAAPDPRGQARRDRGPSRQAALAVSYRRDILGRGDHRPARHALAALRVRAACRTAAHAGAAGRHDDQAVIGGDASMCAPRAVFVSTAIPAHLCHARACGHPVRRGLSVRSLTSQHHRHCERSEAIQYAEARGWIASLRSQ